MTYKKSDLVEAIATTENISKVEAEKAVNKTFEGIQTIVGRMNVGDTLQLVGLITLELVQTKSREGSHPKTKERILIKGKKHLKAKMGKVFQVLVAE